MSTTVRGIVEIAFIVEGEDGTRTLVQLDHLNPAESSVMLTPRVVEGKMWDQPFGFKAPDRLEGFGVQASLSTARVPDGSRILATRLVGPGVTLIGSDDE